MKLAVVSHLDHYRVDGGILCAWPAAVRELDALASLAEEVVQVACLRTSPPPRQATSYAAANLRHVLVPPAGGRGIAGKLEAVCALPGRVKSIEEAWRDADAVLVRCPSNVAVAALLLMTLGRGPVRRWVKYTGDWRGRCGERWSYRVQRWWLRSGLTGATVTVGGVGCVPAAGADSLCNPCLSGAEATAAELETRGKSLSRPLRFLCVGRLVADKGVAVAIRAVAELRKRALEVQLDVAGDGPERQLLEGLARALGVGALVRFQGWLGGDDLAALYARTHVLLAPSSSDGWSRAWTEAAARRCVPVVHEAGGATGLEECRAGLVLRSLEPVLWADALQNLLENEARWRLFAERGPSLARRFTYERFLRGVRPILGLDPTTGAELCEEGA